MSLQPELQRHRDGLLLGVRHQRGRGNGLLRFVSTPWTFFVLNSPVYAGNYQGGGESSYFFGLLSDRAPVLRTMWVHTDSGWVSVTGYAPPLP